MNNDEERPNPDALLKAIYLEENKEKKGRLKIFLGMAAGVGKTYAMLEEAQKLHQEGVDLVVGIVDTHGREDTAKLLNGLKIIPEKVVPYKNSLIRELDLDKILETKPQLVLVDELAHSNAPDSRHPKRWQDVVEILENGIDVYTTLNVQHIESLKEIIESITGIAIRETVPDSIIESATFIELIDITTDELLQRLKEGKVYLGDQAKIAIRNFFQEDRLTALREIILRYAAEKVDHDLHGMTSTVGRTEGWKMRERLLVAVSHSPHSQKLIRTTRRLAFNLDAPWIAVHINDGTVLSDVENGMLAKNLALARDLGAEVITINDPDVAEAIQRIARQKGVTQVIVGRPPKKSIFDFFKRYPLLDTLARESNDLDIHVIRQFPHITEEVYKRKISLHPIKKQLSSYVAVFSFVVISAVLSNWFVLPFAGYQVVGIIFLLTILGLSLVFTKGPVFFASTLYAIIWNFIIIPPTRTRADADEDNTILVLYFFTAIITGILADRAKEHKAMLLKREETYQALYEIVRDIASLPTAKEVFTSVSQKLGIILHGTCEILIKRIDNGLIFHETSPIFNNEKERGAVIWVFENNKEAGWSTSTLPMSEYLYVPLKAFEEVVGVLAYKPQVVSRVLTIEEKNFLYTIAQQLAEYVERSFEEERNKSPRQ